MPDIDPNAPATVTDPAPATDNEPAVVASTDPAPIEAAVTEPVEMDPVQPEPAAPVDIPDGWASMHWKQIVALAKKIAGEVEITLDDARHIIADELATRSAVDGNDGLIAMSKNGDVLHVHPSTVDAHKRAGWALV